jgi:hypothetical protein
MGRGLRRGLVCLVALLVPALAGCGGSGSGSGSTASGGATASWSGVGTIAVDASIRERVVRRYTRRGEEPPPTAFRALTRLAGLTIAVYTEEPATAGFLAITQTPGGTSGAGLRAEAPAAGAAETRVPGFLGPLPGDAATGGQLDPDDCTRLRLIVTRRVVAVVRLSGGPARLEGESAPWEGRGRIQEAAEGTAAAVAADLADGSAVVIVAGAEADRTSALGSVDWAALEREVAALPPVGADGRCRSK